MKNGVLVACILVGLFACMIIGAVWEFTIGKKEEVSEIDALWVGLKVVSIAIGSVYACISLFEWLNTTPPLIK